MKLLTVNAYDTIDGAGKDVVMRFDNDCGVSFALCSGTSHQTVLRALYNAIYNVQLLAAKEQQGTITRKAP